MKREPGNFCLFAIALLLLLVIFYAPFLFGQQSFYLADLTNFFEPFSRFIGNGLRHGQWPIWNPLSVCGMPQIAVPSPGMFYPFTWLNAIMSFSPALSISLVVHQWVTGIGSYLLIGSLGWGAFPAAVFGLAMALCGYMFSLQANYTLIETAAWIPLSAWSVGKMVDAGGGGKGKAIFLTAFSISMMISAGRPEIFFPGVLLVSAYATVSALNFYRLDRKRDQFLEALMGTGSAIACGVLLAMPSLLPPLEWARLSSRAHGLETFEIFVWSSNWYDFLSILLPQSLGDLTDLWSKYLPIAASRFNFIPYVPSAFLGIVFTFAIWGLTDSSWRWRPLVLLLLGSSLVMTLGNYTPISPWLSTHFQFLALFRFPVKLLIFFLGAMGILAARGAYVSVTNAPRPTVRVMTFGLWGIFLLLSLGLALSGQLSFLPAGIEKWSGLHVEPSLLVSALCLIGQSGLRATAIGLCLCVAGECLWRRLISRQAFCSLVLSALAATLLAGAWLSSRHGADPGFFEHPSYMSVAIKNLMAANPTVPGFRVLSLSFDPIYYSKPWPGIANETRNPSNLQYGRQLLLPSAHMDAGLPSSYGYESAETSDCRKLFWGIYKRSHAWESQNLGIVTPVSDLPLARYCQMTSTVYAYGQVWMGVKIRRDITLLDPKLFDLVIENRELNLRIYRVANSLPRVFFPQSWSFVDQNVNAVNMIIDSDKTAFDPQERTILLKDRNDEPFLAAPTLPLGKVASYKLSGGDAEHLTIAVNLAEPRLMVLADQYYPGWAATLDHHPLKIWRANGILRAIFIPAGSHTVQFDYKPASLVFAFQLAGFGLAWLMVMLTFSLIPRRE